MLDVNNIKQRIQRIHISLSTSYDNNPDDHVVIFSDLNGNHIAIGLNPVIDDGVLVNFFNIIHNIASIKDHLKKVCTTVEKQISNSQALQIIIDLDNADKHGYPLKKPRSGSTPRILNPKTTLLLSKGNNIKFSKECKVIFNPSTGEPFYDTKFTNIELSGTIVFDADIVNDKNEYLMSFQNLIQDSLSAWEAIIKNNHI